MRQVQEALKNIGIPVFAGFKSGVPALAGATGGYILGFIDLQADMPRESTELTVALPNLGKFTGKHALFFTFHSEVKEQSLCTLEDFQFK